MLGSKTPNSDRKPASIRDSRKGDRPRSGPPPLWEAAEGRLVSAAYFMEAGFPKVNHHKLVGFPKDPGTRIL